MKKKGGSIVKYPFHEIIEDFISKGGMIDINPKKGLFTWTNKRIGLDHIASRLDRFLVHNTQLEDSTVIFSSIISQASLDHMPISLEFQEVPNHGNLLF
jgi:hypothetical protein